MNTQYQMCYPRLFVSCRTQGLRADLLQFPVCFTEFSFSWAENAVFGGFSLNVEMWFMAKWTTCKCVTVTTYTLQFSLWLVWWYITWFSCLIFVEYYFLKTCHDIQFYDRISWNKCDKNVGHVKTFTVKKYSNVSQPKNVLWNVGHFRSESIMIS